jgi:hypothetical protein
VLEYEVEEYIARYTHLLDPQGHRLMVRNGHCPPREIQSGIGAVEVRRPRVNDRRIGEDGSRSSSRARSCPPI